jgi:N,N'-diacetyllegionaminate synthase
VFSHIKPFVIAEIGQAHEGSLGIAHSYIDALASTGVDAVKFQTHIAEAESSEFEPFRIQFSYEDNTRLDYWRRTEFTEEQWIGLKAHCDRAGLEFISSPFSNRAVELLERLGVQKYKIGSGEINNLLMLEKVARTGKAVILSSGMSTWSEIENAVQFLSAFGIKPAVLQCTTAYPTSPEQWGLSLIPEMKRRLNLPVGFSDHSGDIYASLAATALGAEILEFHTVFDKRMFGPDSIASITIEEIKNLVSGVRAIALSLTSPVDKAIDGATEDLRKIFGKSLAVNRDLPAGYTLTADDLEAKKPQGRGIDAASYKHVEGKKLRRNMLGYEFLNEQDIE